MIEVSHERMNRSQPALTCGWICIFAICVLPVGAPRCMSCLTFSTGGIGEAVCAAVVGEPGVTVTRLAVSHVPRSGKSAELLKMFGIDKDAIVQAVKVAVSKSRNAE